MRIAIVGCGIAGPATAIFLKEAGHRVSVFERAPRLGPVGAGILLQPGGLAVLERLGCKTETVKQGAVIRRLEGFQLSGRRILDLPYTALRDGLSGTGIHRGKLFTLLLEKMNALGEGFELHTDSGIRGVRELSEKEVILELENGDQAGPFDLVVVADGARAQALCGSWRPESPSPHAWGAWWMSLPDPEGQFTDTLHQVFDGSRRLLGVLPTGCSSDGVTRSVSIFWGIRLDQAERWQAEGVEKCRVEMRQMEPRLASVLEHWTGNEQMTLARYFSHHSRHWFGGRVVSVGDAAHAMSPHLGQGANLALLDAAALCDSLQENDSLQEALLHYQERRQGHVAMYHLFSRIVTPFFQSDLEAAAKLRDSLMPIVCRVPWLQRRMLRVLRGEIKSWGDLIFETNEIKLPQ